jgi:hypothetical protein
MSALPAGLALWLAAFGLALLVGMAVKRRLEQARKSAPRRPAREQVAMDERIRARLEATIWPD